MNTRPVASAQWLARRRGWRWVGPDGWEIVRDVDPYSNGTRFGVWRLTTITDFQPSVALAKRSAEDQMRREPPTRSWFPHPYSGHDTARSSVGWPGHCDHCYAVGHVVAHPDLGCGDVGCTRDHRGE